MKAITLTLGLALAPALVAAQTVVATEAQVHAKADVSAIPVGLSAETRAKLVAMIEAARNQDLPTEPISDRMAEGKAKGASEAQIIAASARAMGELEASQQALIRAGREHPSDEEVERGSQVIARGATSAELEAFVRHAPSDRPLEVAFEVLTQLAARGVPVDHALTVIGSRLSGGASDGQLVSVLGSAHGQAGLEVSSRKPDVGASASGTASGVLGVKLPRRP